MRISDWSSDVCSSDLSGKHWQDGERAVGIEDFVSSVFVRLFMMNGGDDRHFVIAPACNIDMRGLSRGGMSSLRRDEQRCGQDYSVLQRYAYLILIPFDMGGARSEEHTSELQSLMRISYAV